jgi:hypothetical protein
MAQGRRMLGAILRAKHAGNYCDGVRRRVAAQQLHEMKNNSSTIEDGDAGTHHTAGWRQSTGGTAARGPGCRRVRRGSVR